MRVTCSGAFSRRAANSPAKPPPTITTRREPDVAAMAHPDLSLPLVRSSGLDGHDDCASARGHHPDEGIAGTGARSARPSSLRRGDAERPSGGEGGPASLERTNRHNYLAGKGGHGSERA